MVQLWLTSSWSIPSAAKVRSLEQNRNNCNNYHDWSNCASRANWSSCGNCLKIWRIGGAQQESTKKFSFSPCAYFTHGPNAAASIAPTLIRHWVRVHYSTIKRVRLNNASGAIGRQCCYRSEPQHVSYIILPYITTETAIRSTRQRRQNGCVHRHNRRWLLLQAIRCAAPVITGDRFICYARWKLVRPYSLAWKTPSFHACLYRWRVTIWNNTLNKSYSQALLSAL